MCDERNNGILEILSVIQILQQNAECPGTGCLETCDRGFLGCEVPTTMCNTRPIMIYTCGGNGTAWSMPISKDPTETTTSNIFRVEKVEDGCATFRVLTENTDPTQTTIPYVSTNSFFTMSSSCICAIRCLQDTYVDLP